jgi:hypothetical protein
VPSAKLSQQTLPGQKMQISSAVGYFIEGAKLCDEEEQEAPKNENEEIIDEIFDLSDSDYRYYRENFFEKST